MAKNPKAQGVPVGWPLALGAAAAWGFAAVVAKDAFAAVPPARLAQFRALFAAAVLMAGLAMFDREALRLPRNAWRQIALFGGFLALVNGSYYLAIGRLPVGVAVTIQYVAPLIVLVIRRRVVAPRLWVAAVAALAGTALVAGAASGLDNASASGILLAAVSALAFAGYLLVGEGVGRRLKSTAAVAWGFTAASVVWAMVQPVWGFPVSALAEPQVAWRVAVVASVGTILPFLMMVAALQRMSAGPAGVLATTEPAFAALFAFLILNEALAVTQWAGLTLVVAGVAAVQSQQPLPDAVSESRL